MKININEIRIMPESMNMGFNFCVFGTPSEKILSWANHWGFKIEEDSSALSGKNILRYTNILIPKSYNISKCFEVRDPFQYVDGFSPNLNKNLHIGHLSNLIIAKAFQNMGIGNKFIAILGDTLDGEVSKEDALQAYNLHCANIDYKVDDVFMASEMVYDGKLEDGEGEYVGTEVFAIGNKKIVGRKGLDKGNSTTYFYQDVALANHLNASTLYMTGSEQKEHFNTLKEMFPHIEHVALGLVTLGGKKQSSRNGNVIMASEVISILMSKFKNLKLSYNVMSGMILKSAPSAPKSINLEMIDNVKMSPGLYLSYTCARLKSAGVTFQKNDKFTFPELEFAYMKAKYNLTPNTLLEELMNLCKKINGLYETHRIQDDETNKVMFGTLLDDLEFGMSKLGMFSIEKV